MLCSIWGRLQAENAENAKFVLDLYRQQIGGLKLAQPADPGYGHGHCFDITPTLLRAATVM